MLCWFSSEDKMKKLQRSISFKDGGIFRVNSKEHGDDQCHMLENTNEESHDKQEHNGIKKKVETFERKDTKHKAVRRSKTLDRNVSFDKSPRGKTVPSRESSLPDKCQICFTEYTSPKQLPCLHTFCQNCLDKFVNPRIVVQCPTCRKVPHNVVYHYHE